MSASMETLSFLKSLPEGRVWTVPGLAAELTLNGKQISRGAVSGLVNRLLKEGRVQVVERKKGRNGKTVSGYRVVELDGTQVREMGGPGGIRGRTHRGKRTTEQLAELLLQLASELSSMRTPLELYETKELLKELQRRVEHT